MRDLKKKFPNYFENFKMPVGAKEECITVYRACKTNNVDKESFENSYEENDFRCIKNLPVTDPGNYSLSTYEKPKDVKRFAILKNERPPLKIAKGITKPCCGLCQRTKERVEGKNSHVDWWLYEESKPYEWFNLIEDFESYLRKYTNREE